MDLPKLSIAALGGTVSMQASNAGEGVIPTVSGEALLTSIPELTALARSHRRDPQPAAQCLPGFRVFAVRIVLG